MEKKEYEIMFNLEDDYWWYAGLRVLVLYFVNKLFHRKDALKMLDAGCGTGGLLARCGTYKTYGLEISEEAIKFCKIRKLRNIIKGSVCTIPFSRSAFNLVISLDVLCSLEAGKDIKALEEFYQVLDKDGILLLNLPAYNFLQSEHDKAVNIKHRYIRKELKRKLEEAGFEVGKITYRNTILFPLLAVIRFLKGISPENKKTAGSDLKPLPGSVNKFLTCLLFLENKLLRSVLNFPFGLSLFCIARKKKSFLLKER